MATKQLMCVLTAGVMTAGLSGGVNASTVNFGTLTQFDGGDAAEGLDLTGTFAYALNLGGTAQTVQGVNFADTTGALPAGVASNASTFDYTGLNGGSATDFGATADDNALEAMVTSVFFAGNLTIDLDVLSGQQYKLQVILQEGFGNFQGDDGSSVNGRKMDLSLEGALAVEDFEHGIETNGVNQVGADFGKVFTYTFTASDSTLNLAFDQVAGANENVTVGALTLEVVPEPGSLALMAIGGLCVLRRRRGA